jgi:hypothetical protein
MLPLPLPRLLLLDAAVPMLLLLQLLSVFALALSRHLRLEAAPVAELAVPSMLLSACHQQ